MFPIKSGIPIPVYKPAGRPGTEYPFVDLMVSDSFFVPLGAEDKKVVLNRVRSKVTRWKKTSGLTNIKMRVSAAIDPDTNAPAIGVWRVA